MNTKHVSFSHEKGGATVTTATVNVAWTLAQKHRVLIIDTDTRGDCATSLGLPPAPGLTNFLLGDELSRNVVHTRHPSLDLLPSDATITALHAGHNAELNAVSAISPAATERTRLAIIQRVALMFKRIEEYDILLYDSKASGAYIRLAAMSIADHLVIPTDLKTLGQADIPAILAVYGQPSFTIAPGLFDARKGIQKAILSALQDEYGDHVATPVPNSVQIENASNAGMPVVEFDPACEPAKRYQALALIVENSIYA